MWKDGAVLSSGLRYTHNEAIGQDYDSFLQQDETWENKSVEEDCRCEAPLLHEGFLGGPESTVTSNHHRSALCNLKNPLTSSPFLFPPTFFLLLRLVISHCSQTLTDFAQFSLSTYFATLAFLKVSSDFQNTRLHSLLAH